MGDASMSKDNEAEKNLNCEVEQAAVDQQLLKADVDVEVRGGTDGRSQVSRFAVRKYLGVVFCTMEIMFFSGIHYGYPNLVPLLKESNIFACDTSSISANQSISLSNTSWTTVMLQSSNSTATLTGNDSVVAKSKVQFQSSSCEAQEAAFRNVFEIAGGIQTCSPLLIGILFDAFGTRTVKVGGFAMFVIGVLLVAFINSETGILLYLAMPLISVSSVCCMITNFQIAELFTSGRFIVLTLLTGAYDTATIVFWLVRLASEKLAISRRISFIVLAVCAAVCFVVTTFVCLVNYKFDPAHIGYELPRPPLTSGRRKSKQQSESHGIRTPKLAASDEAQSLTSEKDENAHAESDENSESDSFWAFLPFMKTRHFWFCVFWFGVQLLRMLNFFSTIFAIMERSVEAEQLGGLLTALGFILMCGMAIGPLSGLLIDTLRKRLAASTAETDGTRRFDCRLETQVGPTKVRYSNLLALVPSLAITSALCVTTSACLLLASYSTLLAGFVFMMAFRSFLFGTNVSFIMLVFPARMFGKLFGMVFFITGVISLVFVPLQTMLIEAADKYRIAGADGYRTVSALFLVLSLLSFVHPIQVCVSFLLDSRRSRRSAQSKTTADPVSTSVL